MSINPVAQAMLRSLPGIQPLNVPLKSPVLPAGVVPKKVRMAMDDAAASSYAFLNTVCAGMGFLGYPLLSELTQQAEYRDMSERVAAEMVRKWIRLKSCSDQDKTDEIAIINKKLKEFNVRDLFRQAAVNDGFFGRGQIFVDIKGSRASKKELESPLLLSRFKIDKGALQGFKIIEPIVTFPFDYNSINPLSPDYYVPRRWYVMGTPVHSSRILTFISRPMPDLLKPAYNFGGMSMSQLAMPAVENWKGTRDSVNRIISSFSTSGVKSDLSDLLGGGEAGDLISRMEVFANMRDNQGVLLLDKAREDFFQFNVPLSGLDKLQAQAQEHMAAVAHTPLIILLGISPTGLNASSEGEIRVFYDYVHDQQEVLFRKPLEHIIKLIQLSEFQAIDEDITFEFEPLWQMDGEKLARIRKSNADSAIELIAGGVISTDEERQRLAKDPDSGYEGLNLSEDVPPPPDALVEGKDPLLAKVEGLTKPLGAV